MTAKGILLFLLLLLSSGSSFSFASFTLPVDEQETAYFDLEFEEDFNDLYKGNFPFSRTVVFNSYSGLAGQDYYLQAYHETLSQLSYIKRSKKIVPGLDVPDIIFPFHGFF